MQDLLRQKGLAGVHRLRMDALLRRGSLAEFGHLPLLAAAVSLRVRGGAECFFLFGFERGVMSGQASGRRQAAAT